MMHLPAKPRGTRGHPSVKRSTIAVCPDCRLHVTALMPARITAHPPTERGHAHLSRVTSCNRVLAVIGPVGRYRLDVSDKPHAEAGDQSDCQTFSLAIRRSDGPGRRSGILLIARRRCFPDRFAARMRRQLFKSLAR